MVDKTLGQGCADVFSARCCRSPHHWKPVLAPAARFPHPYPCTTGASTHALTVGRSDLHNLQKSVSTVTPHLHTKIEVDRSSGLIIGFLPFPRNTLKPALLKRCTHTFHIRLISRDLLPDIYKRGLETCKVMPRARAPQHVLYPLPHVLYRRQIGRVWRPVVHESMRVL